MLVERDPARVSRLFARVKAVEDIAGRLQDEYPAEAGELLEVARGALADAAPVSSVVAANLLSVSETTVRAWVRAGVLRRAPGPGARALDPARLREVVLLAADLRRHGERRDLREALWRRLQDDALAQREDLAESLAQMQAGELLPARTRSQERANPEHR